MNNTNSAGNEGFDQAEFLRQQATCLHAYKAPILPTEDFELMNSFFGNEGRRFVFLKKRRWTSSVAQAIARGAVRLRKRIEGVLPCK